MIANPLFANRSLKLAVLEPLLRARVASRLLVDSAIGQVRSNLSAATQTDRVSAAVRAVCAVPFDPAALSRVERLDFDTRNPIYALIESGLGIDTRGETGDYVLRSLQGIGALTSLSKLDLVGYGSGMPPLDLSPLAQHPSLAWVRLNCRCVTAGALETLPKLTTLELEADASLDDPTVIERLRARGVTIA